MKINTVPRIILCAPKRLSCTSHAISSPRCFSTRVPEAVPQRRVVVTGLGLVTPLGTGVDHSWKRLIAGETATRALQEEALIRFPCRVAATVPRGTGDGEFDLNQFVPPEDQRKTSGFINFALAAAAEALKDANVNSMDESQKERAGLAIGSGIGSIDDIVDTSRLLDAQQYRRLSPHFIPKILVNLAAGQVSMRYGLKGPNHAASTACATGAHSIGDAYRLIKFNDADLMLCGGTESSINAISLAGFSRAKALATRFNDQPEQASRPFDKDRDGFVMGEGAGIMVLEELEHAKARGANIYAEIRGYGLSGDAHHITAPSPDGSGAARAMQAALRYSGLGPKDVSYINAHATSTPLGDAIEVAAIKHVFGQHSQQLGVSSTKGAIGHLLGAAGAVEAIFAVLAIKHGIMPPTVNLVEPDAGLDLNFVPLKPQQADIFAALSNSFGFGGTNASLVFSKLV